MKGKTLAALLVGFSVLFISHFSFAETSTRDYSGFKSPRHITFNGGVWSYGFDVSVNIDVTGRTSVSIHNIKPKHEGSWASLNITAETHKISRRTNPESIGVSVKIKASGRARSFSVPVVHMGDSGKYQWGETSDSNTVEEWTEFFLLTFDDHPELEGLEEFEGDTAEANPQWANQSPDESEAGNFETSGRILLEIEQGIVTVLKADGTKIRGKHNMELEIGDTIQTGSATKARVILGTSAIVKIKPATTFSIPHNSDNKKGKIGFLKLVKGFLWARAKKDRDSLKIATPNAICGVRGTEFEVSYTGNVTMVKVTEGTVWLSGTRDSEEIIINAGQTATIPRQELPQEENQNEIMSIAGAWESGFGDIVFSQSGSRVTGTYTHDNGKIEGELNGHILRGKWSEKPSYKPPRNAGEFEFVFSKDGKTFSGKWRYGFDKKTWDGSWRGKLIN